MVIENKNITRICTQCDKEYRDKQIIVNGVPCCKFAICPECIKALQIKMITLESQPFPFVNTCNKSK